MQLVDNLLEHIRGVLIFLVVQQEYPHAPSPHRKVAFLWFRVLVADSMLVWPPWCVAGTDLHDFLLGHELNLALYIDIIISSSLY